MLLNSLQKLHVVYNIILYVYALIMTLDVKYMYNVHIMYSEVQWHMAFTVYNKDRCMVNCMYM